MAVRALGLSWLLVLLGWGTVIRTAAADWPAYRGNGQRTGYTAEPLPPQLELAWQLATGLPDPAWPSSDRMTFDRAPQAVLGKGRCFFGSSADNTVYAVDTQTGQIAWRYQTGGPVRFAPLFWQDRVFATSDDGVLYALAASDGRLLWSHRGGPDDSLILGNRRLISRWPARGGAALYHDPQGQDTLYYGVGIWPSDGIYLYGLDPATGQAQWKNTDSGSIYMPQPHGGANAASGVAAQGYLAIDDKHLWMATGRAVPAVFERADGKFKYFHLQKYGKNGGGEIAIGDGLFVNSGLIFDTATGISHEKLADGALAVLPDGLLLSTSQGLSRYAYTQKAGPDRRGEADSHRGLKVAGALPNLPAATALLVAADQAVLGGKDAIQIVDLGSGAKRDPLPVEGTVLGLAYADGCLVASTDAGHIYAFRKTIPNAKPGIASLNTLHGEPAPPIDPATQRLAAEILQAAKIREGYAVDLSGGDGSLAIALAQRSELQIYVVQNDAELARLARARIDAAGLTGRRVTVHVDSPGKTRYPNSFADLVVSSSTGDGSRLPAKTAAEAARLQRPWGGVVCTGAAGQLQVKARGPLEDAGEWTHQYANAANTSFSSDRIVKGPLRMLWFRDSDLDVPQRHGRGPAPLFSAGRLYMEGLDSLVCADAYNGRQLWEHSLPGVLHAYDADHLMGTSGTGSNYCLSPDGVYVRQQDRCLRLDPASGKKLAEFTVPELAASEKAPAKKSPWGYIACEDGILLGTAANDEHVVRHAWRPADMVGQYTESRGLFALDSRTGKVLWKYPARHSIRHNAIALGNNVVYLIDRPLAEMDQGNRTGEAPAHPTGILVALDAKTGEKLWETEENIFGTLLVLSVKHEALLMSYQPTRFKLPSEIGGKLAAFDIRTGRRLWEQEAKYTTRPMVNDRTVYAEGGAWDLLTGDARGFPFKRSYGCGQLAGCEHLITFRSATLGYFDLTSQASETESFGGIRPGCWINALPVGGLVLVPDASAGCRCSYLNQAWIALEPEPEKAP